MDDSLLRIAGSISAVDITARKKSKKKLSKSKKKTSKPSKKKSIMRRPPVREMSFEDMSLPQTEYSASMTLDLSVCFEGNADKSMLMAKFKQEIIASIESGVEITARSFNLTPSQLRVKPLKVNFVVNDAMSLDDDLGF